jgi:hypothetical protein
MFTTNKVLLITMLDYIQRILADTERKLKSRLKPMVIRNGENIDTLNRRILSIRFVESSFFLTECL